MSEEHLRTRDEDGDCKRCGGAGCEACDARFLPPSEQEIVLRENPDALLVAGLSQRHPTLTVPELAEIVEYVRCWENPFAEGADSVSSRLPEPNQPTSTLGIPRRTLPEPVLSPPTQEPA